jgi:hypothetical protein
MLLEELCRYIGQTVTIFTTSGGASGCGFTGVLLRVNPVFVTLVDHFGTPPANPLSESICGDRREPRSKEECFYSVGSVCDIPTHKIASFCHNSI